jgi:hypothetical protein
MAEPNVYVVPGATEVEMYLRNYTYAAALTHLANLAVVLFTDLNRLGYKHLGSLRKLMEDGSGSSNITPGQMLYADANGRAVGSSGVTISGGFLTLTGTTFNLGNGFSLVTSSTAFELYKDGIPTGWGYSV